MFSTAGRPPRLMLLPTRFGARTVQPVAAVFVQDLLGNGARIATFAGIGCFVTGFADLRASPFLGKRSDVLDVR